MPEMIIECNKCEALVNAEVIGFHEEVESFDDGYKVSLTKCPRCGSSLVAGETLEQVGYDKFDWGSTRRLWPEPQNYLSLDIPIEVRDSLEEAQRCFRASAFNACAVMCGRAIEAICVTHTKEKTLQKGLKDLKDKGIVDGRLFEWGESLRRERNLGAHATGAKATREDARDIIDFAIAICEYVFVLSARYDIYRRRKGTEQTDTSKTKE